jgi:hypothetical protein
VSACGGGSDAPKADGLVASDSGQTSASASSAQTGAEPLSGTLSDCTVSLDVLFCSIANHRAKGMETTVEVT